jgi:adenylate cyclase
LESRPRAIGVDIYRDLPVAKGHRELADILTKNPSIIAVMKFGGAGQASVPPPAALRGTEQVGFNDVLVDRDGVVRRGLLFLDDGEHTAYSFSLRLALLYLEKEGIMPQPDPANPQYLRLRDTTFTPLQATDGGYTRMDARGYQFLLDYKRTSENFASYPFSALLGGTIPHSAIADKVVLIGVVAESVPDIFHTPLGFGFGTDRQGTYGVGLHAYAIDQLLRAGLKEAQPIRALTDRKEAIWIFVWALAGGSMGIWVRSAWRFSLVALSGLIILASVVQFAFVRGLWIPFVPPALVWLSSAALVSAYTSNQERQQRALLMQLFSRHVSPEVADTIWQQREQFFDGGRPRSQKLIVTVLFTDLEGFTLVAEKMDPQALMDWTNSYIEVMAQVVMRHGGIVDDYYGDAIKANFGVPLARQTEMEIRQDAMNAVDCALDMEKAMNVLCRTWQEQQLPRVRLRVGVFTGSAVAGSLGSAQRLKYTTIGDTVNIAARLESYDKDTKEATFGDSSCRTLIGASTLSYLDGRYHVVAVGSLSLKGKDTKIPVYHLVGRSDAVGDDAKREERI